MRENEYERENDKLRECVCACKGADHNNIYVFAGVYTTKASYTKACASMCVCVCERVCLSVSN